MVTVLGSLQVFVRLNYYDGKRYLTIGYSGGAICGGAVCGELGISTGSGGDVVWQKNVYFWQKRGGDGPVLLA